MQLAGELSKISLPSLLQLLRNGQLTGKVCFTQGANTAFVYVSEGKLVHAETDAEQGRAALLELFLWLNGTFSFSEADAATMPHSLSSEEPIEKIIREGLAYLERKKHLDQLRISARTILVPAVKRNLDNPVFQRLDGKTMLGDIAAALNLKRFDYIDCVYELLAHGYASVVEPPAKDDVVQLPAWVVSRLKQDNPDISQAIVQMVIWVDRVKCWMYQADADLEKVIGDLGQPPLATESAAAKESKVSERPVADSAETKI